MKTFHTFTVRAFPVKIEDMRTGEVKGDCIVLDKATLQAAQLVGQSSKEIIERLYHREGYKVLYIGKADKLTIDVRLDTAFRDLTGREVHID